MKRSFVTLIIALIITLTGILALATVFLTGCSEQGAQQTTKAQQSSMTSTTKATTTFSTKTTINLTLYFIKEFRNTMFLVQEKRKIPATKSVARVSVEELIKGSEQKGLISMVPPKTKVLSIKIANALATVDFSGEVLNANTGSAGESLGITQIVNTLAEFPNVKMVKFLVEGKDRGLIDGHEIQDWWGHVGLYDQPFSRNESLIQGEKVQNNVVRVESPRAFTFIDNPLTIKGQAQAFEAQFNVRILDKNSKVLADVSVMADGWDWGNFEKTISYAQPEEPEQGTVLFYYYSPKDGSEVTMAPVTVFFK